MAAIRMRPRDVEKNSAAIAAGPPVAAVTGTESTRSPPSRGVKVGAIGEQEHGLGLDEEEHRRRSRKGENQEQKDKKTVKPIARGGKGKGKGNGMKGKDKDKDREKRRRKAGDGGDGVEGGSSRGGQNATGWKQPPSAPLAWTPSDGTRGRQEDFRPPGELGDDFFGDSGSGSGSDSSGAAVSALTAYARLDPTVAATAVPKAFAPPTATAPAPAFTYAAGYAAPRRMEGFGGGSSGWGGGGGSAARGTGPGTPSPSTGGPAQQSKHSRYDIWHVLRCGVMWWGLIGVSRQRHGADRPASTLYPFGASLSFRLCEVKSNPSKVQNASCSIV